MKKRKAVLMFKGDTVASILPLDTDEEKFIDKLLEGMAVGKLNVPCG